MASRQAPHPSALVREIAYGDPARLFAPFAGQPGSMLLDGPPSAAGRHAFIAVEPFQWLESKNGAISLDGRRSEGNPFAVLRRELARFPLLADPGLPPLQGGVVGYFGYELARHLERLPAAAGDDRQFPDLALGFYDVIVAFDRQDRRAWILSSGHPEADPAARRARADARLQAIAARLAGAGDEAPPAAPASRPAIAANFSRDAYQAAVQRVIDYILAGDIFQANLSQRFDATLPAGMTPWDLYRRLRAGNPAELAAYLQLGGLVVASASPGRLLPFAGDP